MRIDEYGYVIQEEDSAQTNTTTTNFTNTSYPIPWYGKSGVFWMITLAIALVIAYITSTMVAPMLFETSGDSSDFLESITNFLFGISSYVVFIGTFIGCIWYNASGTKSTKNYHSIHEYILSPLCSIAGAVGSGLLIFLLALAVYIIAAILGIVIVVAIIGALLSGG